MKKLILFCGLFFSNLATNASTSKDTLILTSNSFHKHSISKITVAVNGNINVNSNTSIVNSTLLFAPNTNITIQPGVTLTINKCKLYTCSNQMWDGINILPGGNLIILNSLIEDAKTAILSDNTGAIANFNVDKVTFNRNYIGIKVINFVSGTLHPGKIINSDFDSQPSSVQIASSILDAPYNTQIAQIGIELNGVNYIQIGDATSPGLKNKFRYLRVGIRAQASKYYCYNNDFQNNSTVAPACVVSGVKCGWAIWNTKTVAFIGGTATNQNNNFKNIRNGIYHEDGIRLDVINNTFHDIGPTSTLQGTAIYTTGFTQDGPVNIDGNDFKNVKTAVHHFTNPLSIFKVTNNLFKNFNRGVWCVNNQKECIYIIQNDFNQGPTSLFSGTTGITVENTSTMFSGILVWVESNTIFKVNTGILFRNIQKPFAKSNTVGFANITSTTGAYFGIKTQGCDGEVISQNNVYKQGAPLSSNSYENVMYGISVETNLTGTYVSENTTQKLGTGLRFRSYFNANSSIKCNIMDKNRSGMTLDNVNIGAQGTPNPGGTANDNSWDQPSGTTAGAVSIRGISNTPIAFYTRGSVTQQYPWSPTAIVPASAIQSNNSSPVFPINALGILTPQTCNNICYNPPCTHQQLAKIARNQAPFNTVVDESKFILQEALIRSVLTDTIAPDTTTADGRDLQRFVDTSLTNNNAGKIALINQKFVQGDTLAAISINAAINPKSCADDYRKIVNAIFLNTWGVGNFNISSTDSTILYSIASQDPLYCGIAIYDARVMLGIDFNDSSLPGHTMMQSADNSTDNPMQDKIGILYPNPAQNSCTYEAQLKQDQTGMLLLYNIQGKLVASYQLAAGDNKLLMDLSNFDNGMYFYKIIINGEIVDYKKLLITK